MFSAEFKTSEHKKKKIISNPKRMKRDLDTLQYSKTSDHKFVEECHETRKLSLYSKLKSNSDSERELDKSFDAKRTISEDLTETDTEFNSTLSKIKSEKGKRRIVRTYLTQKMSAGQQQAEIYL